MRGFAPLVAVALLAWSCGPTGGRGAAPAKGPAEADGASSVAASSDGCAPAGWSPIEMISSDLGAGDRPPGSTAEARVLAWRIKEDERPLHGEEALVGVTVKPLAGPTRWLVLHVFRHPRSDYAAERRWRLAQIADTDVGGVVRFDAAPPTATDIEGLLARGAWADGLSGFRELSGGLCRDAWFAP